MLLRHKIFAVLIILALAQLGFLISSMITPNYYPWLIAPLTQIASIVIGLFTIAFPYRVVDKNMQRKVNFVWGNALIILGAMCTIFMFMCKFYMVCFLWMAMGIYLVIEFRNNYHFDQSDTSKELKHTFGLEEDMLETQKTTQQQQQQLYKNGELQIQNQKQQINSSTYKMIEQGSDSNCCVRVSKMIGFIFTVVIVLMFSLNMIFVFYYKNHYTKIGNTITINYPRYTDAQSIIFHTYCSDVTNSPYPTIVLEHGGGGNLGGFLPLFAYLKTLNIKGCAFDRLGYGRSGKAIPGLTSIQRAQLTNLLMQKMIPTVGQKIIYGGWSAGVQIAMIYQYYYPQNIKGLILMDGYPDYLVLQAINKNLSDVPSNTNTLAIANILRILQPYCVDMYFGSNDISNQTYHDYYMAYYRTGYLWQTQSVDLQTQDSTQLMSQLGKQTNATLPYPLAKVYLNWPNTQTNLLFLAASQTIAGDNNMYGIQAQKYINKCVGIVCQLSVINGGHDFPTVAIQTVGDQIIQFVNKVQSTISNNNGVDLIQ